MGRWVHFTLFTLVVLKSEHHTRRCFSRVHVKDAVVKTPLGRHEEVMSA